MTTREQHAQRIVHDLRHAGRAVQRAQDDEGAEQRPPQIRWANSHCASHRRTRRAAAPDRRARARWLPPRAPSAAIGDAEDQARGEPCVSRRNQLELVQQFQHDEQPRAASRTAGARTPAAPRAPCRSASPTRATRRRAPPPAHRGRSENQPAPQARAPPRPCAPARPARAHRSSQSWRKLDDASRLVGRGSEDIAPEIRIEHVRRSAEQRLRIGRTAPVRERRR